MDFRFCSGNDRLPSDPGHCKHCLSGYEWFRVYFSLAECQAHSKGYTIGRKWSGSNFKNGDGDNDCAIAFVQIGLGKGNSVVMGKWRCPKKHKVFQPVGTVITKVRAIIRPKKYTFQFSQNIPPDSNF